MPTDEKPSRNEDEYFVRLDAELLKAQRAKLDEARAAQRRTEQVMKCPRCGHGLVEEEHRHVKVDTCPNCGGTWLDRGELELLEHVDRQDRGGFLGSLLRIGR